MLANPTLSQRDDQVDPSSDNSGKPIVIDSRFGTLVVEADNILKLPSGLLGFGDYHDYGLAPLPDGQHPHFQVLQCLEAPDLAFLVAPLNLVSNAIDERDLAEACGNLGINRQSLALLLIVTVRRTEENAEISVNLRAPVFVDVTRRTARQYVLPNSKYSIRHTL